MGGEVRQEAPASPSRFSHFFFPLSSLAFAALDLSYLILVGFVFFFSFLFFRGDEDVANVDGGIWSSGPAGPPLLRGHMSSSLYTSLRLYVLQPLSTTFP